MLENGKIGVRQFTVLVIFFQLGTSFLLAPSGLATAAKQDAVIASILGIVFVLLSIPLYVVLGNKFPNLTITQISEEVLGKWLGKTVSLLYFLFFFILASQIISNFGYFITAQLLPETPKQSIMIIFTIIIIMAVYLGIEVWTRAAEIFFPFVIGIFLFIILAVIPEIKIQRVEPVFEEGLKPILRATIPFFGLQQSVIFLMLFPTVNRTKSAGKALFSGTLLAGIMIILITLMNILVLGADLTARNAYSTYALAKKISIGNFVERLESVVAGVWFLTIFFKVTICFYASALGLAQICNLKEFRPLLVPLGVIMVALGLASNPNQTYIETFIAKTWPSFALMFMLFLPLFLLGITILKGKLHKTNPT